MVSARVSMPPKVVQEETAENQMKLKWKIDLMKSEQHWLGSFHFNNSIGWFKGLTQSFLNIKLPKLLMVAEKERMDKDLIIA